MPKPLKLEGKRFGRLTVIKRAENIKSGQTYWLCKCDCENTKIIRGTHLVAGKIKSCGCISIEKVKQRQITHNLSKTRLYHIYRGIKSRCYNPKNECYRIYGGRGIIMCDEWLKNFEKFYSWAINNGYRKELSIDRINNDGNYEPNNCRWATIKEQSFNKRNTIILEYNNEKHTAKEWSKIIGISYSALLNRVKKKMPLEKIFYKGKLEEIGILDYDRVC